MKPFDIELAKAGHPVQTKDGKLARIICFDRKGKLHPIVALIYDKDANEEWSNYYTLNGKHYADAKESFLDLFMAPHKKEGWINIYKSGLTSRVYGTKDDAIFNKYKLSEEYEATIKIEWDV